jgi:hypothetical protein
MIQQTFGVKFVSESIEKRRQNPNGPAFFNFNGSSLYSARNPQDIQTRYQTSGNAMFV